MLVIVVGYMWYVLMLDDAILVLIYSYISNLKPSFYNEPVLILPRYL
jgi:hypothetical protein